MTLFVDTSVWCAAADAGDRDNARGKEILGSGEPLVTTDHVLVETWSLLRRRLGRDAADRSWDGLRRAAAFDRDFAVYRFGPKLDQALTVVR